MMNKLRTTICLNVVIVSMLTAISHAQQGPALPPGLGGDDGGTDGPTLPAGLNGDEPGGPSLPEGLGDDEEPLPEREEDEKVLPDWLDLTGFWEVRGGVRTQADRHQKDASVGETRLQLKWMKAWKKMSFRVTGDFLYDPVLDHHSVDLQSGQGWFNLREANVSFTPLDWLDIRLGRQILTWGTGDLIFINDLFPKDWISFFIGRDVEYLKAPSDAIKLSAFSDFANVDVVYVPQFDGDRYVRGRRISYWSNTLGRRAGRDAVIDGDEPNEPFRDDEFHLRIFRNLEGLELAAYGYWGYWKSPGGLNPVTGEATFPRLNVYGASARKQIHGGIGNVEFGYYDSKHDRSGEDPFINNDQIRFLVGYERDLPEVAHDLRIGMQYYLEWMQDYEQYKDALPTTAKSADEFRHVLTFRISKQYLSQNLTLSMFAFYSPSDSDAYLRPKVSYKIDDHWSVEFGGNVFFGAHPHTFFTQFARNSNVYAALRYGF
ncbi:MAG: hypothetical protein ACLFVU_02870 [Phycisphaerae bacterium]